MEYITYKIIEISKLNSGGDKPKIYSDTKTNECCFPIFSNGLQDEGLYGYTDKATMPSDTITVSARGANIGEVFYRKEDFLPIVRLITIIPDSNYVHSKYLYYYLKKVKIEGSGSAQPQITIPFFSRHKIVMPKDVEYQKKVAYILSTYDSLIENNNKRIKLLEQMAENLYKEWFVRFRFPGYEDVEFEEKKPRGWQVGTEDKKHFTPTISQYGELRKIGSFVRGKNITAANMIEGAVPVISAGLQPSGYHNEANVYGASLTISASGANAGYLQYHLQDIWTADCSYYQDDATIWFVYNTLKYIQPVISNLQCGAAQPHVYPKNINKLCVLIPTEELIYKFNEYVKPYYDEIKIFNQRNQLLTKQRDMLLPRLMSGKLEV